MRFCFSCISGLLLAGLLSCGMMDPAVDDTDSGSSTTLVVTSTTEVSGSTGTTGSTGGAPTSSSAASSSEVSGMDSGMFIEPRDLIIDGRCSAFTQDCPTGQKCNPYADRVGIPWNARKCVPLTGVGQAGAPCFAEGGGFTGLDDCDLGFMCWEVGPDDMGTCVPLCGGSPEMPACGPGTACAIWDVDLFGVCLDGCDPLAQDCPTVEEVCIATPAGDGFLCVIKNPEESGQVHDVCTFLNDCDAGLICGEPTAAGECVQDVSGCCEPYCDLEAANMCPGVGQECVPYFAMGMAPTGYANVGFCSVPL